MAIFRSNDTKLAPRPPEAPGSELARRSQNAVHPVVVYLASLGSSDSRRVMRGCLRALARMASKHVEDEMTFPWFELRYEHTQALRARLIESGASPRYIDLHLSALRGVLKECWRLRLMSAEDYHRARDIRNVRGSRVMRGREVAAGEISALFDKFVGGGPAAPAKARDAALLAVLIGAGLRRQEAIKLELRHFDDEAGTLKVRGKGNKERLIHLPEGTRQALAAWVRVRGAWQGALFVRVRKNGKLGKSHMTPEAIYQWTRRMSTHAAVKAFAPHDLRRTYVTTLFRKDVDVGVVMKLTGHAKVETALRYDMRGEEEKTKAAGLLHVPFRP